MADDADQSTVQDLVDNRQYGDVTPKDIQASTQRANKDLSPQSTSSLSFSPTPKLKQYDAPYQGQFGLAPGQNQGSPFDAFANPMLVLAGLSSLFTRHPLMGAMTFAGNAMKGYREGQNQVFEENQKKFHDAIEATIEQNKIELNKYNAAWDRKKEFDWQKVAPKLLTEAVAHQDTILQSAIEGNRWDLVEKILIGRETAQDRLIVANGAGYGGPAAQEIGESIISGEQPPVLTGLYKQAGPTRAYLAQKRFDLSKALIEWQRAQKQVQALNGPQMTKFFSLANSVVNTIDEVRELSQQMDFGGLTALNDIQLQALVKTRGNTPEGQLASRYLVAVNTLKEEFANLAAGGYAPTEPAWKLADEQINGSYGVKQLDASLTEVQRLIRYRMQGISGAQEAGPTAPNRYIGSKGAPITPGTSPAPSSGRSGGFDREAAKKAGYTDAEIDEFLRSGGE